MPGMSERKWRGPMTLFCESRRFRRVIAFAALTLIGYPLSVGPVCWISSRWGGTQDRPDGNFFQVPIVGKLYRPLTAIIAQFDNGNGETAIAEAFNWYSQLLAAETWNWHWFSIEGEWSWGGLR